METHGNIFQKGFPDLFICHKEYGHRWVEVKVQTAEKNVWGFTEAQREEFPKLCVNGSGVWVITAATEQEYRKLWQPSNWHHYTLLLKRKNC
jgi:hypothetical protein